VGAVKKNRSGSLVPGISVQPEFDVSA